MAFKRVEAKSVLNTVLETFVLDSAEDVKDLPVCAPMSMAIVASGGTIFMVNASGEWVNFTESEG